jgi:hypothetical protein
LFIKDTFSGSIERRYIQICCISSLASFLSGNTVEVKMLFWGLFLYFYCEKPSLLLLLLLLTPYLFSSSSSSSLPISPPPPMTK